MCSFKTHCFPLSSDAVTNSWKLCFLFASFLLAFPPSTMEHFCCNWLFTACLGHAVPTLKLFLSRAISFFSLLWQVSDYWKKKKSKLYWGKMFRLLKYTNVAVAVFLKLCYFCVLQNPCLGYKLQQKEQTLPPVSIYTLFKLLLARPLDTVIAP